MKSKTKFILGMAGLVAALVVAISGGIAVVAHAQQPQTAQTQTTQTQPAASSGNSIGALKDLFVNGLVPCGHQDASIDPKNPQVGARPSDTCTLNDVFIVGARVTNFLLAFSGAFVVYKMVDASFSLVSANGNPTAITEAKGKFLNAFWGLLLILMAFLLVTTVFNLLQVNNSKNIITNPTNYIKGGQ